MRLLFLLGNIPHKLMPIESRCIKAQSNINKFEIPDAIYLDSCLYIGYPFKSCDLVGDTILENF